MLKRRSRLCVVSLAAIMAAAVYPVPADAASTRAEYIGQVDPICQSYVGPLNTAFGSYHRNFKRLVRAAKSGTVKSFIKATNRTAGSLNTMADVHQSLVSKITPVAPVPADAGTIGSWLGYLGQEGGAERAAALALASLRFKQAFQKLRQADQAMRSGQAAISGFGFQVCGISVY